MNKISFLIFLVVITTTTFGHSKITIDKLVDTTDNETKKVVTLWINYLESQQWQLCRTRNRQNNKNIKFI